MNVAMIGLGKLGLPVSCAMTQRGHTVYGYDIDPDKRSLFKTGQCSYYEPDMEGVLQTALSNGLYICDTIRDAVNAAEIVFIAVPTPSKLDHSFDTSYVEDALARICQATLDVESEHYRVVSIISTVLPGTCRSTFLPIVDRILPNALQDDLIGFAYNAQFIAMGTTVQDFLDPEFVLVGQYDTHSGDVLGAFYTQTVNAPVLRMSLESAETTKMAYNCYIGNKLIIANAIMELCHNVPGADCDVVSDALSRAYRRILGPRYMKGGMGDGGNCFPAGEIVITEDGPRPIEQVQHGDRVLTVDGTLQEVVGTWERQYDGGLISVKVRGLPTIRVTSDHRMIAAGDGRPRSPSGKRVTVKTISDQLETVREVVASDLTSDDLLPWPVPVRTHFDVPDHVTPDYIELAGWYLSKGHLEANRRRGRVGIYLNGGRMTDARRIGEILVQLSPPKKTGRGAGARVSIVEDKEHNTIRIRYGSKVLAHQLAADFGKGAPNKRIPPWIVWGSLDQAKLLMCGLWQGDGHTDKRRMSLSTTSLNLAWSVYLILLRCGIDSTIDVHQERITSGGQRHRVAYDVTVGNKRFLSQMAEITGLEDKSLPQAKLYENYGYRDGKTWRHVTGMACQPYKGPVYNLWVEGNNTYVVGCGAVHNCHGRDNLALSCLAQQLNLSADPFAYTQQARDDQSRGLARLVSQYADETGLPVAILGITFKPETNLTDFSAPLLLGVHLQELGISPAYHDPIVQPDPLPGHPHLYVIAMRHGQYRRYTFSPGSVIIDPWRMFAQPPPYCTYIPIGRNPLNPPEES
jgi:UDP-glucose 6-dehydrogenase